MATGQTPTYLLPYPLSTDPVDVHGDIFELADRLEDLLFGMSIPSQSGNNGKVLTTNGSALSWTQSLTNLDLVNPTINNLKLGYTTTVTAAGTTTLTADSNFQQFFTGTTTQTVVLPVASTMTLGQSFHIENASTGNLTVNSSGGNLVATVIPGVTVLITCILTSGTTAASWDLDYHAFATITGTGSNVLATSPTLSSPSISNVVGNSVISASSSSQTSTLWAAVTNGTIGIGNGLTTGALNLATNSAFNGTVSIATGAGTVNKIINIGTNSTAGTTTINIGSTSGATSNVTINGTPIPASKTLVDLDSSQTLLGKILTTPVMISPEERTTVSATAATGTVDFDALSQGVLYYTANASANWTLNVRGNVSTTLNTSLAIGDSITVVFLATQGSTAYYPTAFQIDGSAVTPKWQGGTAPSAGNASSIDAYTYSIIKTAANTYTVLGSQTKFA